MGNSVVQVRACCCNSPQELSAAAMDMVAQQGLSQSAFLKEIQIHNPNNGKVEEEIQFGAQPSQLAEARREDDEPPDLRRRLLAAVRLDDAPGVLQFVADGADVGLMSEALRLASHRGSSSVVRELVAVGLSVNDCCPSTGFSPLQLAAVAGHMVVCELLLDALADVHRPVGGSTALMLARKVGNVEIEEVIERHVASMMMSEQGEADEAAHYRRAHVLPRVSPILSEVVLRAMPEQSSPSQVVLRSVPAQSAVAQASGRTGRLGRGELLAASPGRPVSPPPPTPSSFGAAYAGPLDPQQVLPL